MRWRGRRRSSNVIDSRGRSTRPSFGGGSSPLLRLLPLLLGRKRGKFGIIIVVAIVAAQYFGINIPFLGLSGGGSSQEQVNYQPSAHEQELANFTAVVLADTEETWHSEFQKMGSTYTEPRLELFTGAVKSACGRGEAAMGPFYCPGDQKVYIDLSFFDDLSRRHGAAGDFAQAYVIAHEVGHHIQTITGISSQVHKAKQQVSETEANVLSVKQELQADCLAGVWAHNADKVRGLVESGDVQEALTAAAAIGDDRLQKQSRGYATPESFTHGTSEQRVRWFKQGMSTGKFDDCDTFSAQRL